MDKLDKLKELKGLFDDGLIIQEEFTKLKAEVINNKSDSHHQSVDEKTVHVNKNTAPIISEPIKEARKDISNNNSDSLFTVAGKLVHSLKSNWGYMLIIGAIGVVFLVKNISKTKSINENNSDTSSPINNTGNTTQNSSSASKDNTKIVYVNGYRVTLHPWIPEGYEEGLTCDMCDGSSVYTDYKGTESVCAGCNGRGFKVRRK